MDKAIEFTQIGGVRLDMTNATWPFAKITVSEKNIKLKILFKEYSLKKEDVIGLRKYNGLFSTGLLIEHNKSAYPHHIVFWTFGFKKLKTNIEKIGFSVGEPKKSDAWWKGGP